jgi:hypothetical protein
VTFDQTAAKSPLRAVFRAPDGLTQTARCARRRPSGTRTEGDATPRSGQLPASRRRHAQKSAHGRGRDRAGACGGTASRAAILFVRPEKRRCAPTSYARAAVPSCRRGLMNNRRPAWLGRRCDFRPDRCGWSLRGVFRAPDGLTQTARRARCVPPVRGPKATRHLASANFRLRPVDGTLRSRRPIEAAIALARIGGRHLARGFGDLTVSRRGTTKQVSAAN